MADLVHGFGLPLAPIEAVWPVENEADGISDVAVGVHHTGGDQNRTRIAFPRTELHAAAVGRQGQEGMDRNDAGPSHLFAAHDALEQATVSAFVQLLEGGDRRQRITEQAAEDRDQPILARQRDGRVFTWYAPDDKSETPEAIPVRMLPTPIERTSVTNEDGKRIQVAGFQMVEVP